MDGEEDPPDVSLWSKTSNGRADGWQKVAYLKINNNWHQRNLFDTCLNPEDGS